MADGGACIIWHGWRRSCRRIPDFRLSPTTFFEQSSKFEEQRKVFAWYMVCCGAFGGQNVDKAQQVNQYKAEIQIAESMGIDGFGLDIMEPNDAYHTIGDDLYITTALTAPARLEVVSGPTTFYYDLPGGLNQTVVPFEIGSQSFSLWRNSTRIAAVDGEPVVVSIDYYDYWPTIGCVEAHPPGQPVNPSVPHVAQ